MNFNDLVVPNPEPPVLRWVNPQAAELAIVLRADEPGNVRYGFSDPSAALNLDQFSARYLNFAVDALRIGHTLHVRRPQRIGCQERIRVLQKMQSDWPAAHRQLQEQIDALGDRE